ncbi:helix-turn-helix domain-containing protein [Mediterraneibacter gnavus]|uniref:helix-turn-helix domain-containing protein n=1 Tax=Mediterraneibacter gnavus TaxID=33038 RepID=UPI0036D367A2
MGFVTDNFSKRLKTLRETAELTQEQLAKELKVSRGAISYYEKGERTPDIEFLDSVSEFFGLPIDYLLGYSENIKEKHKDMYTEYGLTDEACDELEGVDSELGHIISHIITNSSFLGIRHLIETAIENYRLFGEMEFDYISFILTKHLQHLIADALNAELNKQYTENDLKEIRNSIDRIMKNHYNSNKEYEKHEKELAEALKKRKQEREEYKQNSIRFQALRKIHDKLSEATMYLDNN